MSSLEGASPRASRGRKRRNKRIVLLFCLCPLDRWCFLTPSSEDVHVLVPDALVSVRLFCSPMKTRQEYGVPCRKLKV